NWARKLRCPSRVNHQIKSFPTTRLLRRVFGQRAKEIAHTNTLCSRSFARPRLWLHVIVAGDIDVRKDHPYFKGFIDDGFDTVGAFKSPSFTNEFLPQPERTVMVRERAGRIRRMKGPGISARPN